MKNKIHSLISINLKELLESSAFKTMIGKSISRQLKELEIDTNIRFKLRKIDFNAYIEKRLEKQIRKIIFSKQVINELRDIIKNGVERRDP